MRIFGVVGIAILAQLGWSGASLAQSNQPIPRFRAAEQDVAWKLLLSDNQPLTVWVRTRVQSLPQTTGSMLELDYIHRAKNPLGSVLTGKLRWVAADAIGCEYGRRYAEADLRRAGLTDDDLKQLRGSHLDLREADRAILAFARKLTRAAHRITDDETAELINRLGPEKGVGMVHTLAYTNFQNRIFLALGLEIESDGPLPPIEPHLDPEVRAKVVTPARPSWEELQKAKSTKITDQPDWGRWNLADLEKAVDGQKKRKSRIPLPDPGRFAKLPPDAKEQASKIVWTNVSMGYQPLLTKAWFDCMRMFQHESKLDRVFSNSMFWVITRSNECFY